MRRWGSYISTTAPVKYSNVKPVTFPVHELGSNHPNGHGTANVRNHDRGESVLSPQVLSRDVVWLPQVCHHISRFLSRHYRSLFPYYWSLFPYDRSLLRQVLPYKQVFFDTYAYFSIAFPANGCLWYYRQLLMAQKLLDLVDSPRVVDFRWRSAPTEAQSLPALPRLDLTIPSNVQGWASMRRVIYGRNFAPGVELKLQFYVTITLFLFLVSSAANSLGSAASASKEQLPLDFILVSILRPMVLGIPIILQVFLAFRINGFAYSYAEALNARSLQCAALGLVVFCFISCSLCAGATIVCVCLSVCLSVYRCVCVFVCVCVCVCVLCVLCAKIQISHSCVAPKYGGSLEEDRAARPRSRHALNSRRGDRVRGRVSPHARHFCQGRTRSGVHDHFAHYDHHCVPNLRHARCDLTTVCQSRRDRGVYVNKDTD